MFEPQISRETAEENVDQFFEYYDIFIENMDGDRKRSFGVLRDQLVEVVQLGRLEMLLEDGDMTVCQHLSKPIGSRSMDKLVYREMNGKANFAAGKHGSAEEKVWAILGVLSGLGMGVVQSVSGRDLNAATSLGTFFLML